MISLAYLNIPFGSMVAAATDRGICLFDFRYRTSIDTIMQRVATHLNDTFFERRHPLFDILTAQTDEYFAGKRKIFDLPIVFSGTTFQEQVWRALLQIPYGELRTYEQQAQAIGMEKSVRAVAAANGENGIAIIVPCHRVVGKNGSLTGYSGGLAAKKKLIELESRHSGKAVQTELFL